MDDQGLTETNERVDGARVENHTRDAQESASMIAEQDASEAWPQVPASRWSWLKNIVNDPRAPLVVGVGVLVAAAVFGVRHYAPSWMPGTTPRVVVFDPVRFINAQRAVASILAVSPTADSALTLTQVAKQSEAVIRQEAHGALVLVKQAVVVPDDIPDITDAVLAHFGLPTKVPTLTTTKGTDLSLDNLAPTNAAFSAGRYAEDYHQELLTHEAKLLADQSKKSAQAQVVP